MKTKIINIAAGDWQRKVVEVEDTVLPTVDEDGFVDNGGSFGKVIRELTKEEIIEWERSKHVTE